MTRGMHTRGGWGIMVLPLFLIGGFVGYLLLHRDTAPVVPAMPAPTGVFTLSLDRMPAFPSSHYELWSMAGSGGAVRIGAFRMLEGGSMVSLAGEPVSAFTLANPLAPDADLIVTVEPGDTLATQPGPRQVLRGALQSGQGNLAPTLPAQVGQSLALLATPTSSSAPATAGVWFAKKGKTPGTPANSLALPPAPDGWVYNSWVTTASGVSLPMGAFTKPNTKDDAAPFSAGVSPWNVPGEDFLTRAPKGMKFPLNLADGKTVLTVSLEPDFLAAADRQAPAIRLLTVRIPHGQAPNTPFAMRAVDANEQPRGQATLSVSAAASS